MRNIYLVFAFLAPLCLVMIISNKAVAQQDFTKQDVLNPDRWLAKAYNKDLAYKLSLRFITQGILQIPHSSMYALELDALVGSTNGELATVYYYSKEQDKSGLVLAFFNEFVNPMDYSQSAKWKGFKNLEEKDVLIIIENLEALQAKKKETFDKGFDYLAYQYQDLTFVFYKDLLWGKGHIHVYYGDFEADWTDSSFKKTLTRFEKSQRKVGK